MYRFLRIGLGSLFILLGVIGLFLPVLQGILFLAIGCALLYREIPFLRRLVGRIRVRFPSIDRLAHRFKQGLPWRS